MHFLDPERPRLTNGCPQYVWQGKPISAVGHLHIALQESGDYWLGIFACYQGNKARCYPCYVPPWALGEAIQRYYADPEGFMQAIGWSYSLSTERMYPERGPAPRSNAPKLSLEELGL